MGESFGVALFGAVLIARLDTHAGLVPGHNALDPQSGRQRAARQNAGPRSRDSLC
jgi:hypothetical protein